MQPYFLPYLGYYQLIHSVDLFVIYDNIKYTKKGWINRNRMLQNGKDVMFSLPLKNDSDFLTIRDRQLATSFNRGKLLKSIENAYRNAPFFDQTFSLITKIVGHVDENLFQFLREALTSSCGHLGVATQFQISSEIAIDHKLKGQDKVLALCSAVGATTYINAIGGTELYSRAEFQERGINLEFIRSKPYEYRQFDGAFVPSLSILDAMMFNAIPTLQTCIATNYELI